MTRHVTYECDLCHVVIETSDGEPCPDWEDLTDGQHLCEDCVDKVMGLHRKLK